MRLYPAIDLLDGQAVRLTKGEFSQKIVYSERPWEMAELYAEQGAEYIHVVDLDAARSGLDTNGAIVRRIIVESGLPVQTGGGIRSMADIEKKLNMGISRVIIGTAAIKNPAFVEMAVKEFGSERIVVGIDAKRGLVATDGWEAVSVVKATDLALSMKEMGVKTIVYTDIDRDGMLAGPNLEETKNMVEVTGLDIIASGGVKGIEDLLMLDKINVEGVIIGKAIYEKKLDLKSALEAVKKR